MISARAQANQSLYLARIQLQAWADVLEQQQHPTHVIHRSFAFSVQNHLLDAFGWYALTVLGVTNPPLSPPHSCDDLPGVADGKSVPGEIREFQTLEQDGWLGQLQRELPVTSVPVRSPGNLASEVSLLPDQALMSGWADRLEALFDRMGDSLDEC